MWNKRRKSNGKIIFAVLVLSVLIGGAIFFIQAQSQANIIEAYKELDKKDFEIQSSQYSREEIESKVREIYCGPQLEMALDYFNELNAKGLRFKLNSVQYKSIKVLDHDASSAVLLVDSEYKGDYVTVGESEESMREVAVNRLCQIELAREDNKWKIADTIVLKDE